MASVKAESGLQVLARLATRPSISDIDEVLFPSKVLKARDVVELRGGPGCGKTLLATHLLAKCILSRDYGGTGAGAVFINTDHHFQLTSLVAMLEFFLKKGGCKTIQRELKKSLQQLTILTCYYSSQLTATLHGLPQLLTGRENVSLLLFDSPSKFYWTDALATSNSTHHINSKQTYLKDVLRLVLSPDVSQHAITFIYTISDAFTSPKFNPPVPVNADHYKVNLEIVGSMFHSEASGSQSSQGQGWFRTSVTNFKKDFSHSAYFTIKAGCVHWFSKVS